MSEQQLRALLHHASDFAEKVFRNKGEVLPMWHAVRENGEQFIEIHPTWLGKDLASGLIRAQFDLLDVVRYIYIGEAWMLTKMGETDLAAARKLGSIEHHPDRTEVVLVQGEDANYGQVMANRPIIRSGKPRLGPLEITFEPKEGAGAEGRMVGMLPQRGRMQ